MKAPRTECFRPSSFHYLPRNARIWTGDWTNCELNCILAQILKYKKIFGDITKILNTSTEQCHIWEAVSGSVVKKFPASYGTRRFAALCTTACRHWTLP